MKKVFKASLFACITLLSCTNVLLAQSAAKQCTSAVELGVGTHTNLSQDTSVAWFKFEAITYGHGFKIINDENRSSLKINRMDLYSGNCATLSLIATDELSGSSDSILYFEETELLPENIYYLKLTRFSTSDSISNFRGILNYLGCGLVYWINGNTIPQNYCTNLSPGPPTAGSQCTLVMCCSSTLNVQTVSSGNINLNPFTVWVIPSGTNAPYSVNSSTVPNTPISIPFNYGYGVPYTISQFHPNNYDPSCGELVVIPVCNPGTPTLSPNPACVGQPVCVTFTTPYDQTYLTMGTSNCYPQPNNSYSCSLCNTYTSSGAYTFTYATGFDFNIDPDNDCRQVYSHTINVQSFSAAFTFTNNCSNEAYFTASPICGGSNPMYTWNFGDNTGNIPTYGSNITHAFPTSSVPVVYTVQLTVNNGTNTSVISQTVLISGAASAQITGPASLCGTVTTGQYSVTANQSITSITWAATNATISSTAYSTAVNITFANTATTNVVTATVVTANGCTTTVTYSVYPCCPIPSEGYVLNDYVGPPITTHSGNIVVTGTIVVGSSSQLHFGNASVYMAPNARIEVSGTGTLLVTDSYIHGCDYMWDGIYLMGNSNIRFDEVYVADAQRVIIDTLGANDINLRDFIFFKNYKGITLKDPSTTNAFNVEYGIITAAPVPVVFPLTASYTSSTTIGGYSKTYLATPYNTKYSSVGIELLDTRLTNTVSGLDKRLPIDRILFDKLEWGIKSMGSHAQITRCNFQYGNPVSMARYNWTAMGGIYIGYPPDGILDYTNHTNDIYVGGTGGKVCLFKENNYGILDEAPARLIVDQNEFTSHSYGVHVVNNWMGESVQIKKNAFYGNGYFSGHPATAIAMLNNYDIDALIEENFISNSSALGTFASNYGVRCSEFSPFVNAQYTVTENAISGHYNGVYFGQTIGSLAHNNTITIRPDFAGVYNFQQGICASACQSTDIWDNIISSTSSNSGHANDWAAHQHGILIDYSSLSSVRCNNIQEFPISMKAQGICYTAAGDGFRGNYTGNARFGFWLDNYGEIGDQFYTSGTSTVQFASDNEWHNNTLYTYSSMFSNQTAGPNIQNSPAKFHTRSYSPYEIPSNMAGASQAPAPTSNNLFGTNNSTFTSVCDAHNRPFTIQYANDIANDEIEFEENESNLIKLTRRVLYRNILLEEVEVEGGSAIEDFMELESTLSIGKYFAIEDKVRSVYASTSTSEFISNYNEAVNLLVEAPLNDEQDELQREVDCIYIGQIVGDGELSDEDIERLETIAEICPAYGGMAVLQARKMLWPYTGELYTNECELQGVEYSFGERKWNSELNNENEILSTIQRESLITVYPNPAQDYIVVDMPKIEGTVIEVYDLSGRKHIQENLNTTNRIEMMVLENGAYLYRISKDGKLLKVGKLILNR
ncbi:MAG: T9SS type A sorting domain-containing protein [Bacteroidia bacterium]|nr:T9SS type A sorting domain-containing protein [Bacteroidia bacterium]